MPQFEQGVSKTARVPMRNPTAKAFDYTGFIYMGTDLAVMSRVDFHLEAGEEKDISLPVTMPQVAGAYPVYVGAFSGEVNLALYRATEDVTIIQAVPAATITGAGWTLLDHEFVGYWPEETGPLTAVFCKGELQVNSDIEFAGSAVITCPGTVAPVRLLTAYGYQKMMEEIDALIAGSTGATQQLWINRKAIALTFPKVDEFTIDYRWLSNFAAQFRTWIYGDPAETFILDNVFLPRGTSTVKVGFFAKYGAAVGIHPAVVSLYSNDNMLAAIESELVPPGTVPQLLGVSLPGSVPPGGNVAVNLVLRLPPQANKDYYFDLTVSYGGHRGTIAKAFYAPAAMVDIWEARGCNPFYQPLNAPDNIYTIKGIWDRAAGVWTPGKASTYFEALPRGVYPVSLKGESWVIGVASECGVYIYGYDAAARYDFGVVGYLVVT